jgi:hypothetical protein
LSLFLLKYLLQQQQLLQMVASSSSSSFNKHNSNTNNDLLPYDDDDESKHFHNKKVTFGEVTVTEFPIALGSNPACSAGCPIEMAWILKKDNITNVSIDLSMYEYLRTTKSGSGSGSGGGGGGGGQQLVPKQRVQQQRVQQQRKLLLSVTTRARLLMQAGYSLDEIGNATMAVELIQKQRRETLQKSGWAKLGTLLETTGKLPKGIMNMSGDILSTTGGFLLSGVKLVTGTGGSGSSSSSGSASNTNKEDSQRTVPARSA